MLVNSIYFLSGLNKTSVMFLYGLLFDNLKRLKKQYLNEKVASLIFSHVFFLYWRVTRNFLSQGSFLGIRALQ